MKYKIEVELEIINAKSYHPQKPTKGYAIIDIPSKVITNLLEGILPTCKRIVGKNKIITSVKSIKL